MINNDRQAGQGETFFVYVGTYARGGGKGIYRGLFDTVTGELKQLGVAWTMENPSYMAVDGRRLRLYAVDELTSWEGRPGGTVTAFAIEASSGQLSLINQQYSHGAAPCFLALDRTGRYLFTVNYLGGNVVVMPVGTDGALGEPTDIIDHEGSSISPERQEAPHPHSIILDGSQYALVPDLGLDKVMQYRFDAQAGRLVANEPPWTLSIPGSGPRHVAFHPNRMNAYVINELSSTITAYAYDSDKGTLRAFQTISTLPEGYTGANTAAGLHLTPDGKFLLGSNRGHDSIAQFAIDQDRGELHLAAIMPTRGKTPRGFAIDPTGTFVLVANQDSHSVVTLKIDRDKGTIAAAGHTAQIPAPVCLKFVPR